MLKHLVVFAVVMMFGVPAFAQAPAAPTPGPEHKVLGFFAGKWTMEGEMKPGPMGPGGTVRGSDDCEWFNGGFQLVCRGEGTGPLGSMTSMGVMTYSPAEKVYTYYGIDSMGSSELSKGKKTGSTWTFEATTTFAGQTFRSRYTIVTTSPNTYTFKWESSPDGQKWSTLVEGKSTRAAKT